MVCPYCKFISFKELSKCSNCGASLKDRPPEDKESFTVCTTSPTLQDYSKRFPENEPFPTKPKNIIKEQSTNTQHSKSSGDFDLDLTEAESLLHSMLLKPLESFQGSEAILGTAEPNENVYTDKGEHLSEKPHILEQKVFPKEKLDNDASLNLDVEDLGFEPRKPTPKNSRWVFKEVGGATSISPGSEDERMVLGRWIKMGRELIVATFPLGESVLDPNVKRPDDIAKRAQEYVNFDHEVGEKLSHLKGKFRYALETYYRDTWGPYLPSDEDLKKFYSRS